MIKKCLKDYWFMITHAVRNACFQCIAQAERGPRFAPLKPPTNLHTGVLPTDQRPGNQLF